jgi:hypothetical protein
MNKKNSALANDRIGSYRFGGLSLIVVLVLTACASSATPIVAWTEGESESWSSNALR